MQRGQQRAAGDNPDRVQEAGAKKTAEYVGELSSMMLGVLRSVKQDMQKGQREPERASRLRHSEQSALIAICGCCIEQCGAEMPAGREYEPPRSATPWTLPPPPLRRFWTRWRGMACWKDAVPARTAG